MNKLKDILNFETPITYMRIIITIILLFVISMLCIFFYNINYCFYTLFCMTLDSFIILNNLIYLDKEFKKCYTTPIKNVMIVYISYLLLMIMIILLGFLIGTLL